MLIQGLDGNMRKYIKVLTPPSLFSSHELALAWGFSHWLSWKLFFSELMSCHLSLTSKIQFYQDMMKYTHFKAFTPRQRSKFLTDENFCNMVIWYIIGTAIKWYISVLTQWIGIINFSHISMAYCVELCQINSCNALKKDRKVSRDTFSVDNFYQVS